LSLGLKKTTLDSFGSKNAHFTIFVFLDKAHNIKMLFVKKNWIVIFKIKKVGSKNVILTIFNFEIWSRQKKHIHEILIDTFGFKNIIKDNICFNQRNGNHSSSSI
jgi:hypothetical protein